MKTNNFIPLCFLLVISLLVSCNENEPDIDQTVRASAQLTSIHSDTDSTYISSDQPYGTVQLSQTDSIVLIEIFLENFNPNTIHSVHIHSGTCEKPGMHWNMGHGMETLFCNERSLGIPWAKPRAGDVGNVSVGYDGSGYFSLRTDLWKLGSTDEQDILGSIIVVHDKLDDFEMECNPNHSHNHTHTNPKVACGSIVLIEE